MLDKRPHSDLHCNVSLLEHLGIGFLRNIGMDAIDMSADDCVGAFVQHLRTLYSGYFSACSWTAHGRAGSKVKHIHATRLCHCSLSTIL